MADDTEYVNIWMRPERPARGPRPAYSRAQITEAAVRVADAEGLEAASMRRIAAEIGTGAMSLYRYVPSRDDLVELMVDHVTGELRLPGRPSGDWRADLTLIAERYRAMRLRHPWLGDARRVRSSFGPNTLRLLEFGLGALDLGPPIDDVLVLFGMLNGYIDDAVEEELAWQNEVRRSGISREGWMGRSAAYVHRLIDGGDHPMLARVVRDARQPHMDPDARFHYGLERVLDCIQAALPRNDRL
ncbi:TetR/AcrR family transcriptional regulator C-terminal domain-containing protein [Actinomadura viridis]|uniref:AcrR family transcriptional regulator n=1 Tax=Actinomadura viridis TaxID=58110 RepID=A0A931GJY3_9ACTN|nr:TetR/AcrR family transcriptional regulator [Actinomadura viridis]MBG6089660.1 AcrR family transcriptional regulator [Actinomadura viridis]